MNSMIEVDPQLFVTCRLCLEDIGHYQILPSVQQQIKYCFDIDVEPFDGLPQLLCIKCTDTLSKYFTLKKSLCEKQIKLRQKIGCNNKAPTSSHSEDTVNSTCIQSQQVSTNVDNNLVGEIKPKSRSKRVINSSDSEKSCNTNEPKRKKNVLNQTSAWDGTGFKKLLICRYCNSNYTSLKAFSNHVRQHNNLLKKYNAIINKTCSVSLQKIDNKPNITNRNNIVVHNNNKIIENCNASYYIEYFKEKCADSDSKSVISSEPFKNYNMEQESSDTEDELITRRNQRRNRRLLSHSSNETVVIESNSNKVISDNEAESKASQLKKYDQCYIVESSDSESDKQQQEQRPKPPLEAKLGDYKIIQNIITTCVSTYQKKNDSTEKSDKQTCTESQLKHKLLSIGKRTINRQGCNWTGLLKYLEYKNIDIQWVIKALPNNNSKESNYIRIMTKMRGPERDDNCGWFAIPNHNWPSTLLANLSPIAPKVVKPPSSIPSESSAPKTPIPSMPATPQPMHNLNIVKTTADTTLIYLSNAPDPKSKLLNANPVANPKQAKPKSVQSATLRLITEAAPSKCNNNQEPDLCMPIITSTTSLAPVTAAENKKKDSAPVIVTAGPTPVPPRIKVKPVSELMSERTLNNLRRVQTESVPTDNLLHSTENGIFIAPITSSSTSNIILQPNVWTTQPTSLTYISNISPQASTPQIQLVPMNCINVATTPTYVTNTPSTNDNDKKDYVILNTVELPNTRTKSPFQYLSDLLQFHGICLLNANSKLTDYFYSLIKFKVEFTQEPIHLPVHLCLSILCYKNQFCISVTDRNQKPINVNTMLPNWQWEILNLFRGDTGDKIILNAKKQSQETFEYTNKFLCLLKSIEFVKL